MITDCHFIYATESSPKTECLLASTASDAETRKNSNRTLAVVTNKRAICIYERFIPVHLAISQALAGTEIHLAAREIETILRLAIHTCLELVVKIKISPLLVDLVLVSQGAGHDSSI